MKEIVLLVIALFVMSNYHTIEAEQDNGFSIDLIHRNSPQSPFYNSSMNETEVYREAALRSIARSNHFSHYFATLNESKAGTVILPNVADYLIKIFIGTPPIETYVMADTGSSIVWVQCWPCTKCYSQYQPLFNPTKSNTYKLLSCHSDDCDSFKPFTSCQTPADSCRYSYGYADGGRSIGNLAKDVIGFGSNGGMKSPLQTVFGCGHNNTAIYNSRESGMAGLNAHPLSLVSALGSVHGRVFSYCLNPPLSDKNSKLTFQSQSTLTESPGAVSVLMIPREPHQFYFLRLEGVSIDGIKVEPIQQTFDMIIDSGSALTYLQTRFYEAIETTVVESIDDEAMRFPPSPYQLCYKEATKKEVPDITFHFNGGASLRFPTNNMFWNVDEATTCFMILPHAGLSVLGNRAQVNFKVEYDLVGGRITFAPTDCTNQ